MVVLEDEDKLMRDFTHDVSYILGKATALAPFLNDDALVVLVFLSKSGFELRIVLI
jgi:hypothetical protein